MNKKVYSIPAIHSMQFDTEEMIASSITQDTTHPGTPTEPVEGGAKEGFFSDEKGLGSNVWDD